jgi:hypothetical protein
MMMMLMRSENDCCGNYFLIPFRNFFFAAAIATNYTSDNFILIFFLLPHGHELDSFMTDVKSIRRKKKKVLSTSKYLQAIKSVHDGRGRIFFFSFLSSSFKPNYEK